MWLPCLARPHPLTRLARPVAQGVPDKDGSGAIPPLGDSVTHLAPVVDRAVRQNNTIDIYEEYFADGIAEHSSEPPSAKGLAVFRDPSAVKRTVTSIDWHPEGPTKIAVSYSILNFQVRLVGRRRRRWSLPRVPRR